MNLSWPSIGRLAKEFTTIPSDSWHLSLRAPVVRQGQDELKAILVSGSDQLISSFVDGSFPASQDLDSS